MLTREEEGSSHLTGMLGIPSGRCEPGEDYLDTAVREFGEESGLLATSEDFVEFPGNFFQADIPRKGGEVVRFNWKVFRVMRFSGEAHKTTDDVTPMWVETSELEQLDKEGRLLPNVYNAIMVAIRSN